MAELETVLLNSLLADDKAIAVGVMYPGEDTPSGIPLIRVADIVNGRISSTIGYRISEEVNAQYRRTQLSGDEVLMTLVGRPGIAIKVPTAMRGWNAARALAVLRLADPEERDFFVYSVASPQVQHTIRNWCNTTVQATLNLKEIKALPLPWPDRTTRRAIAATLGALDDKIELNRKMNATLEAMARALFRDWFVDFGPTRARMEGHAPYLSPDLWSLFPDRLDDEGKPEGWEEKPLDEVADFLNGLALQKFPGEGEPDSLPVIKIAELRNGITANSNRASRKVPSQYVIKDGDFLFSWSGSLLAKFWTGGEGALNQHLFKVTSDRYPAWFFSEWVQHHLEEFQIIAASKATTMGHIQRGHLKAAMTICPPDNIITRLGEVVAPLIDRIVRNELESRTLAQTRDLLLPRLMSGELRVADLASFDQEAVA